MKWEDYHNEKMKDPEYKAAYDELEDEYEKLRLKLKSEQKIPSNNFGVRNFVYHNDMFFQKRI